MCLIDGFSKARHVFKYGKTFFTHHLSPKQAYICNLTGDPRSRQTLISNISPAFLNASRPCSLIECCMYFRLLNVLGCHGLRKAVSFHLQKIIQMVEVDLYMPICVNWIEVVYFQNFDLKFGKHSNMMDTKICINFKMLKQTE